MSDIITSLQNKRLVWQASHNPSHSSEYIKTGFIELDQALEGGWPQVGVVALQSLLGVGELRLFLPGLKQRCQQSERLLVLIAPPCSVNAEMFCDYGFDLHNILIIKAEDYCARLWSAEQCLKSGCCAAVLIWQASLQVHQVKRLQLAAQQGGALAVFFSRKQVYQGLPLSLSLDLLPISQGLEIKINKRRGGWPLPPFKVNMRQQWPKLTKRDEFDNLLHFPLHEVRS
jgi:cell division inhibitor SulA